MIGLLIPDIQNPFFPTLARAVEDVARAHHYSLLLCNTDENPEKEAFYIDLMVAEKVAGVIISPTRETDNSGKRLAEVGIPLVAIDRRTFKSQTDTVVVDNVTATFELVTHLIEDGHTQIGVVLGVPAATTGHERRAGYVKALEARQLPILSELIWSGPPTVETGYRLVNELLDLPAPPTALFMGNSLLALGALQAIQERGLQIPTDVALVAFDEMEWMLVMQPALTSIAQPIYEMGKTATELLLARLADNSRPPQEVVLQATLHIRHSCARHPKGRG
ncbi:MAG: substrate-binding domain-containing protein [Chloroflexi bacterium]|nr:substrate-binding domain-containing protein [Chloroflexota bacterium]